MAIGYVMKILSTWLMRSGGALVACLMLALVVAPTLDAAMCASDGGRSSATMVEIADQSASVDQKEGEDHSGGSDLCIHGHCHHASPIIDRDGVLYGARHPLTLHSAPRNFGLPPSWPQDRLEEPPRA